MARKRKRRDGPVCGAKIGTNRFCKRPVSAQRPRGSRCHLHTIRSKVISGSYPLHDVPQRFDPHRAGTPSDILRKAAEDLDLEHITARDWFSAESIALHTMTPREVLQEIARQGDSMLRACVARNNTAASSEIFDILMEDGSPSIIEALAGNTALSPQQQMVIATKEPLHALKGFMRHNAPGHRALHVVFGSVREQVVSQILQSRTYFSPYVLHFIAVNNYCSYDKASIAWHPNLHPDTMRYFAADQTFEHCRVLAKRNDLPADLIELFAEHEDVKVRQLLAEHPHLPKSVTNILSGDSDEDIRHSLASKMELDENVLAVLALDSDEKVSRTAAATLEARQAKQ